MREKDKEPNSFDIAAQQAEVELLKLLQDNPTMSAIELIEWHHKWFMSAGHRKLGQIYRRIAEGMRE